MENKTLFVTRDNLDLAKKLKLKNKSQHSQFLKNVNHLGWGVFLIFNNKKHVGSFAVKPIGENMEVYDFYIFEEKIMHQLMDNFLGYLQKNNFLK